MTNHTCEPSFHSCEVSPDQPCSDCTVPLRPNSLESIPPALLDRLEIIEMGGYIADEKLAIACEHLLPRQVRQKLAF